MTARDIYHGDQARQAIAEGMRCLVETVGVTAGPHGRTVMIDTGDGIRITKDGYTVAQSLELPDKFGNAGAALLKQMAYHNDERAGDGSTAGIVMAGCVIEETVKAMTAGMDHRKVLKGLEHAFNKAEQILISHSQSLSFPEGLYNIAYIASNGDEDIAFTLSDIYSDGDLYKKILLNKCTASETYTEKSNGFKVDSGYAAPWFVNDVRGNACVFEQPRLLIVDGKIDHIAQLAPLLEQVVRENDALILIAEDFSSEFMPSLAVNIKQADMKVAAIKIPVSGKLAILEDLAIASGAKPVCPANGDTLDKTDLNLASGILQNVKIEKGHSTLILPHSRETQIKRHIAHLRDTLVHVTDKTERDKIEMRMAALKNAVVTVHIGGLHDAEIMEKKDRYQDALNSLQTALREGVVPGGGIAFLHAARMLMKEQESVNREEQYGYNIAIKALKTPAEQIFKNAGMNERHTVEKILASSDPDFGYDVKAQVYTGMTDAGITDSTIISREALRFC